MQGPNAAAIFIKHPVKYVMAAVFDTPVATIYRQNLFSIRLVLPLTGNAVNDFPRKLAGFFVHNFSLNSKCLTDTGKINVFKFIILNSR